jgi:tetratricopeptide (TPR) repeat protein
LTPEQKELIKRQADDASSQLPTPASLTVQAFSEFIRGQYQGSYDTYTEALSLQSDFNQAYEGRATVDWYLENFPKAYDDFSQALKFDSGAGDRPALLARRAEVLLKLGKLEEAEQDLEEANHSNEPSNKAIVLNAQGLIKIKKQDWQGAEMDFRTAADLEPNQAQARLENIGIVYLLEANWTAAYEWSMKTSKMPRSGEWFWMIEALAAEKLGKSQERRAAVQEFIENNRDPKQSVRALSFYLSDDLAQLGESWVPEAVK